MRDVHRSRVYEAEDGAFLHTRYDEPVGMRGIEAVAASLMDDPWWNRQVGVFQVVATRSEANRSVARTTPAGLEVRISSRQDRVHVLSHECAHLLVAATVPGEVAAHGAEFRTAALDVATVLMGTVGRDQLAGWFRSAGLAVAQRLWEPPDVPGEHGLFGAHLHGATSLTS